VLRSLAVLVDDCSTGGGADTPVIAPVGGEFEHLLRAILRALLHALNVRQSEACLSRAFAGATDVLRRHGARVVLAAMRQPSHPKISSTANSNSSGTGSSSSSSSSSSSAAAGKPLSSSGALINRELGWEATGDSLQDWLRAALVHCNSQRPRVRRGARDFLALLLSSTYHSYGSISPVRTPLLAIFKDMISEQSGELDKKGKGSVPPRSPRSGASAADTAVKSVEDAVLSLAPLHLSLTEMQNDWPDEAADTAAAAAAAAAVEGGAKGERGVTRQTPRGALVARGFQQRMRAFMAELLLVKRAYLFKLRYLVKAASTDTTKGFGLDAYSAFSERFWSGVGATDADAESVQELFLQCAQVHAYPNISTHI
jgi:hypothetical protein